MKDIKVLFGRELIISGLMGLVSGIPLMLTGSLLQAYMKEEGISLGAIGMTSLLGLPYTLKFLWAPFLDRFSLFSLGRRRGWLFLSQCFLIFSIVMLGSFRPSCTPFLVYFWAVLVSFFSATQDIVIDAYRRETLQEKDLGLGSAYYIYGYRLGMLISGAGGLLLSDHLAFKWVYWLMAAAILPFLFLTLIVKEPEISLGSVSLKEAVLLPFKDLLKRKGIWFIATFIVLYKIGDNMAGNMTLPYLLELGFTRTQIGVAAKLVGFWATLVGTFLGGLLLLKWSYKFSLFACGMFQSISTFFFVILMLVGPNPLFLSLVIGFENITSGMGTAALAAFMAKVTNKAFTGTQYALFSSLMGVPRVVTPSVSGYLADFMGWWNFFMFCTLLAIPGLVLLFNKKMKEDLK